MRCYNIDEDWCLYIDEHCTILFCPAAFDVVRFAWFGRLALQPSREGIFWADVQGWHVSCTSFLHLFAIICESLETALGFVAWRPVRLNLSTSKCKHFVLQWIPLCSADRVFSRMEQLLCSIKRGLFWNLTMINCLHVYDMWYKWCLEICLADIWSCFAESIARVIAEIFRIFTCCQQRNLESYCKKTFPDWLKELLLRDETN